MMTDELVEGNVRGIRAVLDRLLQAGGNAPKIVNNLDWSVLIPSSRRMGYVFCLQACPLIEARCCSPPGLCMLRYGDMNLLTFLREAGKYARVGTMLSKDSVKTRLASESGISFTEFTYQLLQVGAPARPVPGLPSHPAYCPS